MSRREIEDEDAARTGAELDEETTSELEDSAELETPAESGAEAPAKSKDESGTTTLSDGETPSESSESATGKAACRESAPIFSADEDSPSEELEDIAEELESGADKLSDTPGPTSDELETIARELDETAAEESADFVSSSNSANKSRTCANDGVKKNKTQKTVTKKRIPRIYKKSRRAERTESDFCAATGRNVPKNFPAHLKRTKAAPIRTAFKNSERN